MATEWIDNVVGVKVPSRLNFERLNSSISLTCSIKMSENVFQTKEQKRTEKYAPRSSLNMCGTWDRPSVDEKYEQNSREV